MNHLMLWSNLYCSELKFSITLKKSTYADIVPFALAVIMTVVSCIVLTFNGLHVTFKVNLFLSCLVGLCCYLILRKCSVQQMPINAFLISNTGVLSFGANQHFQLLNDSFIYPYGCSLSLKKVVERSIVNTKTTPSTNKKHCMIFKDSLNDIDYRRLCRIIVKQNTV